MPIVNLSPVFNAWQGFTVGGLPLSGGLLYSYQAGTTTPQTNYTDATGSIANANPIVLDAGGRLPFDVWITQGQAYQFVLKDSLGNQIKSYDNIWNEGGRIRGDLGDSADPAKGDALIAVKRTATGAQARTQHQVNEETISLQDLGAVGDGATNDDAAITRAGAISNPVYVPWTANFYLTTALPEATRARLWGPGQIKVSGTVTPISSQPSAGLTTVAKSTFVNNVIQPANNLFPAVGSTGLGMFGGVTKRTGGSAQYGNWYMDHLVGVALTAGEFEVGHTALVTAMNLSVAGTAVFGAWSGSNTPSTVETYTAGSAVGHEVNVGNRWGEFALQTDVGGARYTVGLQVVPDVVPTVDTYQPAVTMTVGAPGTVNWVAHGLAANTPIYFGTAGGTLPVAVVAGTTYYVLAAGLAANTFQIGATIGGAAINFAASSSGAVYGVPSFAGAFGLMIARSVHDHRWWVGTLLRYDTIMPGGYGMYQAGGSTPGINVPLAWAAIVGYWTNGLDLSGGSYSNAALKFGLGQVSGTATAGGGIAAPATVNGFLIIDVNGALKRVPYYNP